MNEKLEQESDIRPVPGPKKPRAKAKPKPKEIVAPAAEQVLTGTVVD